MPLHPLLVRLVEEGPAPEDVKAGPIAFVVFIGLILAVAFLGFSLVKQLRKAEAAKDAGVYGDVPITETTPDAGPPAQDASPRDEPGSPAP